MFSPPSTSLILGLSVVLGGKVVLHLLWGIGLYQHGLGYKFWVVRGYGIWVSGGVLVFW